MTESQTHIENENYLEAIESIKEENGPTPDKWTEETLNRMALSQAKLHFYSSAYTYYMLANNKREALKVCEKIQPSAIEEHVKDHKHPDVKIMRVNGRRGVFALKDIPMNTEICKIPLFLCKSGTKKELAEYLYENNRISRSMPKADTFPVTWSPSTCDQIGISPMRIILEQQIQEFKKEEKESHADNYLYLRSLVASRCFADGDTEYLVPFADMLNHSNDPNVEWEFRKDHFIMRTNCPVKATEELFDHYGPKSNYEAFLHYGFMPINNTKLDVVRLIGDLPNGAKRRLDPRYFHTSFEFELRGSYMEGTVEVFSFLRYIRSNDKKCPETLRGFLKKPVSVENELWVCKMLFNILQKEVHRRVNKTAIGVEEPLAILLLQSEMSVLVHWGETLTEAIQILEGNKKAKKSKNEYIVKVIKKLV